MYHLNLLTPDPIFGIMAEWKNDPNPHKVNLGIGIYRDTHGAPFVFPSVAQAASEVPTENFEYELMNGNRTFLHHTGELFLGDLFKRDEWALQQTCGGTHAIHTFANLCQAQQKNYKILVGTPTWANHYGLFREAEWVKFDHLDTSHQINMEAYQKHMKAHPGAYILLQGGPTHNPVGINFSLEQWQSVAHWAHQYDIKVIVDFAYLGFGDGIEADRACLEILYQSGCDLGFGVSYSKNASLYSERVGGTFIRVKNPQEKAEIESQTYRLIRQSLSCLPQYGVRIMNNIFDQKRGQWIAELEGVRKDITERKNNFIKILPPSFEYLNHCRGMFGMMYLSQSKVQMLKEKYSIYLTLDSRVNFAGIRDQDYEYLAEVLPKVLN